jgi:hypothetical protein
MQSVFEFLFKYRPEVFSKGDLVFGAPSSVMLLLALGLLIGGPAGMIFGRPGEHARDRWIPCVCVACVSYFACSGRCCRCRR